MEIENTDNIPENTSIEVRKEPSKPMIHKTQRNSPAPILTINSMEDMNKAIDFVAKSKRYSAPFVIREKQEDGSFIEIVDTFAIGNCLLLGNELGFKPFESIMLGHKLGTPDAVIKIHRGRDLGLSAISSLQNIYVFSSGGGETIYTSIHVIYKLLHEAGVNIEVLEDGNKPYYTYIDVKTKEEVQYDPSIHVCANAGISPKEFELAVIAKKIIVERKTGMRALVRLTRGDKVIALPYTLQDAIDAKLYPGTTTLGEVSKGKNNWENHPKIHLIKMSVMNSARIIIGDRLQGSIYIADELPNVEDIRYVEV